MMGLKFGELHVAQIVDVDDLRKEGRVKIFVPPIMQGWNSDHYPWARPFSNILGGDFAGGSELACFNDDPHDPIPTGVPGSSCIPELGSSIWVWFADSQFYKNPYYLTGISAETNSPHATLQRHFFPTLLQELLPAQLPYPETKFIATPNKSAYFFSTKEKLPEAGFVFSNGLYFYAKEDRSVDAATVRNIKLKGGTNAFLSFQDLEATQTSIIEIGNGLTPATPNRIKIEQTPTSAVPGTATITLEAGTDAKERMCLAETLKEKLEDLSDALMNAVLPSPMGPLPFTSLSTFAQIQQFKTELVDILSKHIKNN